MKTKANTEETTEAPLYEMEVDTLSGDIRDVLLSHVRGMEVGWRLLPAKEQAEKIDAMMRAATLLVRQALSVVTSYEHPNIAVSVGAVKFDKDLEVKLTAVPIVENITALAEHGKQRAVLVLADPETFFGERAPAEPDPDQPDMLGGEEVEAA